ncbi:MAG: phosphonate ABC transporter, permease protein PhnE [Nitratireductor sp.]
MSALDTAAINAVVARHPAVFSRSLTGRLTGWLVAAGTMAYLVFAWWLFSIGAVVANGNWSIAGSYLADWVSYEVRPNIAFSQNHLEISYPRFSPLGANPDPDWVEIEKAVVDKRLAGTTGMSGGGVKSSSGSFLGTVGGKPAPPGDTATGGAARDVVPAEIVREEAAVRALVRIGGARIDIAPGKVVVARGADMLIADIEPDRAVTVRGVLPGWASQRGPGDKIVVSLGFPGRVEIENDEVKIRHRFWGWENFFFDTRSPFWGKSFGAVAALLVSGERVDPQMSNTARAWTDFLHNAEWQHGDVWLKLLQTIVMAFVGTVFASLLAFPLAFMAARNITPNRLVNQLLKRLFDFLRSVDMLIWALFFTRAFGPGPLAGMSAIFFTDTGTFGKLYSEALENIDDKQREGVRSVGAAPALVQRFGVVPQVLPVFLSQSLYFWESNTRSATIIGAVGAGGIGLKLWEAMRTNQDWENVAYMVLLILIVVFVFDAISSFLRQRLIQPAGAR